MKRRARRGVHHLVLFCLSIGAMWGVHGLLGTADPFFKMSMSTAYVSLGLLVLALLLGPLNVIRRRPNPVSTDLRRDIGIWAGCIGIAHGLVGLQVHMRGNMEQYFVYPPGSGGFIPLRSDLFGIANWSGLAAGFILVVLLGTSSDLTLRTLGTDRWKMLHRSVYVCAALVALHGSIYQALEDRSATWIVVSVGLLLLATLVQAAGAAIRHRDGPGSKRSPASRTPAGRASGGS